MVFECPFKHIKANSLSIFQLKLFFSFDFSFFIDEDSIVYYFFVYYSVCQRDTTDCIGQNCRILDHCKKANVHCAFSDLQ